MDNHGPPAARNTEILRNQWDIYLRITRLFTAHQYATLLAEYRMHGRNLSGDSLLILTVAMQALSRQWNYAKLERPSREAFEEGVRFRIDSYGREHVSTVADCVFAAHESKY